MLPFLDSHVGALPEKQIEHVGGQAWDVKSPHRKASVGHYQSEVKGLFIVGPEYKVGIQGFPRGVLVLLYAWWHGERLPCPFLGPEVGSWLMLPGAKRWLLKELSLDLGSGEEEKEGSCRTWERSIWDSLPVLPSHCGTWLPLGEENVPGGILPDGNSYLVCTVEQMSSWCTYHGRQKKKINNVYQQLIPSKPFII